MFWKKARVKALGLGSTLLGLHDSQSGALDAAANLGLFNHESQLLMKPRSGLPGGEPAAPNDRP